MGEALHELCSNGLDVLPARAGRLIETKVPGLVPGLPIYSQGRNDEKFRFLLQSIRIMPVAATR